MSEGAQSLPMQGKTALVSGAGKGIGRATAQLLARRGAQVVAVARTQADLDSLAAETGCRVIRADLADPVAARAAMEEAGVCDYLVNCAGTNVLQSLLEMTDDGYEAVMGINLRAALILSQDFARRRIAAGGGGAIVNVTSIAGHRGFDQHLCYAASKAGLEGATRVMARELGPHGIRVNAVAPTITLTELAAAAWADPAKSDPMRVRHASGRFAEVEEVAHAIVALLSDDMAMTTGAVLPVDGGFLAL
ncbi:SDR family oxidoreductase [Pseudoroseicyclus aestuarii]|uniref:NAD(P)-dependent dehydrogenase (Short-subunit alcohol dehydrogenase family) n=1 Tax=Pseudoroseicyclus aestuarii TaxID=1795041 RepID=A0A318SRA6_9RHOB|nr:SDR family oxidoreductase [Pseudoroseicyclus aestuarii]PYE80628.1 NAD(P)-dependent dehydrogenase (short-subunit alcohol dehydrogenase family) [Pseudoroseicyclus aestuarii]